MGSIDTISLNVHALGMALYGMGRLMTFGMFFTNIGKRFGYKYYGTLAGFGLLISAIFSLCQYPLIAAAAGGDERMVDIASGVVTLALGLPYCIWLGYFREFKGHRPGTITTTNTNNTTTTNT